MGEVFEKHFEAGWRDVDPNGHVANMAYLEYAVDTRLHFSIRAGFRRRIFCCKVLALSSRATLSNIFAKC